MPEACDIKVNTLTVEGSVQASCATECQAMCQKDDCCRVNTVDFSWLLHWVKQLWGLQFFQFFTYNAATRGCGLRNFFPGGRSFSLGNVSGLKNESPSVWSQQSNSVYVAKYLKTDSAEACRAVCLADNDCKAMIFNYLLGQCSLSYGAGPYRNIPLGSKDKFEIYSCLKQNETMKDKH